MTELEAVNAIYSTLIAGWETPTAGLHARDVSGYPTVALDPKYVPLALKNEIFDKSQLGLLGAWVRATIRWSTAEQTTQGQGAARKYEPRGFIFFDIFGPIDQGVSTLSTLAKDARTILRGQDLGGLNIFEGRSTNGPDDPDWATQGVVFPFMYEEQG